MIMMVSGATKTVKRLAPHPNLGVLIVPDSGNWPIDPLPFAMDNGAFCGFSPERFGKMLERHASRSSETLWVTVPDVVSNHAGTLALFEEWAPRVSALGYRLAFVAQNGATVDTIPWDLFRCLFIGGNDAFKLGSRWLIAEAKRRGKWVHVGRVNSLKRLRWAHDCGADSVDGTSVSRFANTWLPRFLAFLANLDSQTTMFGGTS